MNHTLSRRTSLLLAFAVETLSVTWLLKVPGWGPWLSIPYFTSGIAFAWLLLQTPALNLPKIRQTLITQPATHYRIATIALAGLVIYTCCVYWFEEMPIDISNADMLPIIKVMCERFIAGQHSHIYDNIPWIWNGVQPIYLPTMWQPYIPAIAMHIDMRWVIALCLLFVFGVFIALWRPKGYLQFFTAALAFLLFWWMIADNTPGLVSVAEEGTVIAYYVLLVLALVSGKPGQIGIAVSLCILSRYALVGWIPAYIVYLIMEKKPRKLFYFALTGLACFILLFLVPVGWDTFVRLIKLPGDYVAFAARVWHDSPATFSDAPGFAWFFGPHHIAALHRTLILLSFILPTAFMLYARKNKNAANIPLATLKLTLVVFYCFIDVPYLYLFYTSSILSLITITLAIREPTP